MAPHDGVRVARPSAGMHRSGRLEAIRWRHRPERVDDAGGGAGRLIPIAVPTYLLLSTLSPQGLQTLKATPERVFEVNREFEASDVKVLQQWALLGPYDMLSVVTAPGDEAVAKVSAEMAARGSARVDTLTVVEIDDLLAGLESDRGS